MISITVHCFSRPRGSLFSRVPADVVVSSSVEVSDCSSCLYLASPGGEGSALCRAVLAAFTTHLSLPRPGQGGGVGFTAQPVEAHCVYSENSLSTDSDCCLFAPTMFGKLSRVLFPQTMDES